MSPPPPRQACRHVPNRVNQNSFTLRVPKTLFLNQIRVKVLCDSATQPRAAMILRARTHGLQQHAQSAAAAAAAITSSARRPTTTVLPHRRRHGRRRRQPARTVHGVFQGLFQVAQVHPRGGAAAVRAACGGGVRCATTACDGVACGVRARSCVRTKPGFDQLPLWC